MVKVIHSFIGYNADGSFNTVSISWDDVAKDITSIVTQGEFPAVLYNNYDPDLSEGTLIFTETIEDIKYNLYWTRYYPFAYYETDEVTPPVENLTVSVVATNETLVNDRNGTATVSVSGGTPPYEYSLNNVDWQSSNVFTGLSFGNYIAFVRDSVGGLGQAPFTILQGAYPTPPPIIPQEKSVIVLANGELERQGAYKRATVKTVFGTTPTKLYNGDFELYNGQNWDQWVKYGGISLSRGQRTVKSGTGAIVPIENYTLVFNQRADSGKYLEHTSIPILQGSSGKFSINIGNTPGTGIVNGTLDAGNTIFIPARYTYTYEFRMRIKVGSFYLYNVDGGNDFQWVNQLAIVTKKVDNSKGDISSYVLSFNIPAAPISGGMLIDLFGFVKIKEMNTDEYQLPGYPVKIPPQYSKEELNEYTPIEVDDVKLDITSKNSDDDVNGIVSISDNLDVYYNELEPIELLFGDLLTEDIGKPDFESLYAIYDQDDKPTKEWIDLSVSTTPNPIGLVLAKSVMQSVHKVHERFTGSLRLANDAQRFSYLDSFNFTVNMVAGGPSEYFNPKQFVLLGCDIDLKTNIMSNVTLRELFNEVAPTNDISFPVTPNTPMPPIVNDPNNINVIGIFTEEFTQEFK